MLEKLEELLAKYETDYQNLREDWHKSEISFEVYHTEEAFIKGELEAIKTAIAYLKNN